MLNRSNALIGTLLGLCTILIPILIMTPAQGLSNDLAAYLEHLKNQPPAYSDSDVSTRFERTSTWIKFMILLTVSLGSYMLLSQGHYVKTLIVLLGVFLVNIPFLLGADLSVWYPIGRSSSTVMGRLGGGAVIYLLTTGALVLFARKRRIVLWDKWIGRIPLLGIGALCYLVTFPQMNWHIDMEGVRRTGFETMFYLSRTLDAYYEEHKEFPRTSSIDDLPKVLNPYLSHVLSDREKEYKTPPPGVSVVDAWGNKLRYVEYREDGQSRYLLGSAGSDGKWEFDSLRKYPQGYALEDSKRDIVCGPDGFVQWTGGIID